MKTREQLLCALADCKDDQGNVVILKVIERNYKDALRKKNNEAKNLRTRMLDAQMANKIAVEKYERLANYLGLDHKKEDVEVALKAIYKMEKDDFVLRKKLEQLEGERQGQKNISSTTSPRKAEICMWNSKSLY